MHSTSVDVAIIGGGSAGYTAARTAASLGLKTAVIDGARDLGGLCILRGCMPTKALLYAAEVMHLASHPDPWGIRSTTSFDFAKVMARKNTLIREFADYRVEQLTRGAFDLIRAHARFHDAHTLELAALPPADQSPGAPPPPATLTAKHFIIATGSRVAPFPLPQLADIACLTSDTALELNTLPHSMIILGGGAVALEFAQFFARFGVHVTLIQRSPQLLREMDADAAAAIETVFRRESMTVFTGTKLLNARRPAASKEISFEHHGRVERVNADEVLFALGRVPNVAALALDNAGVRLDRGGISVNGRMQTTAPHIYAAGDCAGPHEIVHIAIQQGEIAAHNIAHPDNPKDIDYRLLTEVVFTEPQLASVGLTEKSAAARNIPFIAASYPFNDHGKSIIMEARDGFVKLLADPATGEIIGGGCVGPHGGELIHEIVAVMAGRMTVHQLAAMPHYHPTLAEIWTYPAEDLAGRIGLRSGGISITSPP